MVFFLGSFLGLEGAAFFSLVGLFADIFFLFWLEAHPVWSGASSFLRALMCWCIVRLRSWYCRIGYTLILALCHALLRRNCPSVVYAALLCCVQPGRRSGFSLSLRVGFAFAWAHCFWPAPAAQFILWAVSFVRLPTRRAEERGLVRSFIGLSR